MVRDTLVGHSYPNAYERQSNNSVTRCLSFNVTHIPRESRSNRGHSHPNPHEKQSNNLVTRCSYAEKSQGGEGVTSVTRTSTPYERQSNIGHSMPLRNSTPRIQSKQSNNRSLDAPNEPIQIKQSNIRSLDARKDH